jgi:hypothetical protein
MQQTMPIVRSVIKKIEQKVLHSPESSVDKPVRASYKPAFRPRATTQEIQRAIDLAG